MTVALWWIRRDIRLHDNAALQAARHHSPNVLPVFILDPQALNSRYHAQAHKRQAFLFGGLHKLDEHLGHRGGRLVVRAGAPAEALAALMNETGANAIFAEEDVSPYARHRDQSLAQQLPLTLVPGLTVRPPGTVLKADGQPYTVFTPFSRAWKALPLPRAHERLPAPDWVHTPIQIASEPLPRPAVSTLFRPGESEGYRRLGLFTTHAIFDYAVGRNQLDLNGTSTLSPYLRFGMLSARSAVVCAAEAIKTAPTPAARQGAEAWLNELIWREFYITILYHFPHVLQEAFRSEHRHIVWENDEAKFKAWCEGRTGYPVVDAAMRQLVATGWMHNRARMIVASFLVKDLLIDWRWGERFFMEHLVDGDLAANNGGWQWTAGVGTDAAPYFRVFNPILQGEKFDPAGKFVRQWLPELARVPDKFIQHPWELSPLEQQATGCVIGRDYPAPMVNHALARERVLAAYKRAK